MRVERIEMMKRVVRALILAIGCIAVVVLAGCGGGGSTGGSKSDGGSAEISGTVKIWDTEYEALPEYTKAINQIDANFEKLHPAVTIQREAQPLENVEALYRAAFTAHEGPDMMLLQTGAVGVLSYTQGLEVLNDRLKPSFQSHLTQWESATPGYGAEGDRYGVPVGSNGWVIYYNKELFAKAGLPTDFQPKTWAEVREAGEKLEAAGITAFAGGNKEGYENNWWFGIGFQSLNSPAEAIELAEGEMPYTDPAVTKAFGPLFEMEEAGLYPSDRATTGFAEGYANFGEGKGAMVLGFWNALGYWGEFNPKLGEKNVGFFFPPGSNTASTTASWVMGIPTFAKNQTAAIALLEYEMSKKGMEILDEVGGMMPNRTDVSLSKGAPIQAREILKEAGEREGVPAPALMIPSAITYGPMATEVSQALQGRISLADAENAMQEVAEKTNP